MTWTDIKVRIKFSRDVWILGLVAVPDDLFEIKDEDAVGEFVTKALKDYEWDYYFA